MGQRRAGRDRLAQGGCFQGWALNRQFAVLLIAVSVAAGAIAGSSAAYGYGLPEGPPPAPTANSSPPPGLLENCAIPWSPDYVSIPTIASPSDLEASLNTTDHEVLLTWRDNADNEICIAVVKTSPPGGPSASPAIIGPADTTDTEDRSFPMQGTYCYQVFAGNADGLSALSNEVCVEVPAGFVPVPGSLPPTGGSPDGDSGFSWWPLALAGTLSGVVVALGWRRLQLNR